MISFKHKSVLESEVVKALQAGSGGRYVDGTLGGGGHALAILEASSPDGWLYGCDRDETALQAAQEKLGTRFAGRFELRLGNYADLPEWVPSGSCDGILLDLGVSSPQLDDPQRGFSFQGDGPLDMRMNRRQELTAATVVNESSADELAEIFWKYGDENQARKVARAIVRVRAGRPFQTTRQLAELVANEIPRHGRRTHPATRVFQALRIYVNDEMNSLHQALPGCWSLLQPGGRLAVITFQSGEDRLVKKFGRELEKDYEPGGPEDVPELRKPRAAQLKWTSRKPIRPGAEEMEENPRARSAQLRVMEKIT